MEKVAELIHRLPNYEVIGDIQPELFVWLDVPDGMVKCVGYERIWLSVGQDAAVGEREGIAVVPKRGYGTEVISE